MIGCVLAYDDAEVDRIAKVLWLSGRRWWAAKNPNDSLPVAEGEWGALASSTRERFLQAAKDVLAAISIGVR
jgi:hypothetical protein